MNNTNFWGYRSVLTLAIAMLTITGLVRGDEAMEAGKALADRTQQAQSESISRVSDSNYLGHKDQDVSNLENKQASGNLQDEAAIKASNDPSAALLLKNYDNRAAYKIDPKTDPMFQRKDEAGHDAIQVAERYEDCVELTKEGTGYGEEQTCESAGSVFSEDYRCTETTVGSCGEDQITRYFAVYEAAPHCPEDSDNPWQLVGDECVRGFEETLPALQDPVYQCPEDPDDPWTLVGTQCTRTIKDEQPAQGDPIYACPSDGKEWEYNESDNKCRHYWTEIIPANGTPVFGCLDASYTYDSLRKICWKDTTETRPYESRTTFICDDDSWILEGAVCKKTVIESKPISEIGIGERYACHSTYTSSWKGLTHGYRLKINKSTKRCEYHSYTEYLPNVNPPGRVSSGFGNEGVRFSGRHPYKAWVRGYMSMPSWNRPPTAREWISACGLMGGGYFAQIYEFTFSSGNAFKTWGGANGSPVSCSKVPVVYQNVQILKTNQACPSGQTCVDNFSGNVLTCPAGYTKNGNYCEKWITQSKPAGQTTEHYCPLGWIDNGTQCARGGRDEHPADQVDTTYACPLDYSLKNGDECHRPRVIIVDGTQTGTHYYCDSGWLLAHPDSCYRFRDETRDADINHIEYSCGQGWTLQPPDCVRGFEERIGVLNTDGETYPIEILSSFPPGPGASTEVIESYYDPTTVPVDIRIIGASQLQQPPLFAIDDGSGFGFIYGHVRLTPSQEMSVWGGQGVLTLSVDLLLGKITNYSFEQSTEEPFPSLNVDFGLSTQVDALKAGQTVAWQANSVPAEVCTSLPVAGGLKGVEVAPGAEAFAIGAGVASSAIVTAPSCSNGLKLTLKIPYVFPALMTEEKHTGFGLWAGNLLQCDYSEETNEICPDEKPWNAVLIDTQCAREGWQLINGFPVYRGCWALEHAWHFEEIVMEESQACADLRAQGCGLLSSACTEMDSEGRCIRSQQTYSCGTGGEQQVAEICQSLFPCVDGACNEEYSTAKDATGDLAKAAMSLELMNQLIADLDPDNIEFFSGEGAKCQKSSLGLKNCCADSGWGVDIGILDCDAEEVALGYAKEEGRAIYVGKHSSGTWPDKRTYRGYCTYSSKLARLLIEQGNAQLGKGYGSSKELVCLGFSQEEFGRLDLNAMDFSEYFEDALEQLEDQSPTVNQAVEDFSESIQSRTGD